MHGGVGRAGTHPSGQGLPLGIVLRIPVLASGMEGIATRIGGAATVTAVLIVMSQLR